MNPEAIGVGIMRQDVAQAMTGRSLRGWSCGRSPGGCVLEWAIFPEAGCGDQGFIVHIDWQGDGTAEGVDHCEKVLGFRERMSGFGAAGRPIGEGGRGREEKVRF
jgi:hypothetical protein